MDRESNVNEWLRFNYGDVFYCEGNGVFEKTPAGPVKIMSITTPNGSPYEGFNDYHKQIIHDEVMKKRNSKWGKAASNQWDMQEKWQKDIMSRKATIKKKVEQDGDIDGMGTFLKSTGERIA